jgi:hypothetical protein
VTGGYVYRGNKQTLPFGAYVYGDFCTGEILMFYQGEETLLLNTTKQITSFAVDEDGEIYAVGGTSEATALSTQFDIYSQAAGPLGSAGSIQTGVAIANPSNDPVDVGFHLSQLDGSPSGIEGTIHIPARGQSVSFLRELPGADALATPFRGLLQLSSPAPVAVLAIRGRYNERGEFLLSTTPPADVATLTGYETFIPQVVHGAGYRTEIVIYDLDHDSPLSGNLYFFDQGGKPITVQLR